MECIKTNIILDNKETVLDVELATLYSMCAMDLKDIEYEVLKAIVILKRSEIFKRVKNTPYYEKDYSISIKKKKIRKSIKKAVDETKGEVVISNGRLVELYYTMCCSGSTSNSEDIIGKKLDFVRRIYCDKCSKSSGYKKVSIKEYEKEKIAEFKDESENVFTGVVRDESGRILSVRFLGEDITGRELMKKLNLKSSKVFFKEEVITLRVEGEGEGLGICIEGANKLASEGKSYRDIIDYYYTGIVFEVLGEKTLNTLSGKTFLIDPGHGGEDVGNVNGDILESEVVLSISKKLIELLEEKNADVYLTREDDISITLTDRASVANKIKPDFLISIHLNAFIMPGVNGSEAHCYEKDNEAMEIAEFILDEIEKATGIKKRKVNIGDYFILRESKVSSIILECLYLTGNKDSRILNHDSIEKIANGIFKGICRYYDIN